MPDFAEKCLTGGSVISSDCAPVRGCLLAELCGMTGGVQIPRAWDQTEADFKRVIDLLQHLARDFAGIFLEPPLVDCADLFEQNDAVLRQSAALCAEGDMRRELCLIAPAGNRSSNDGRAVAVPDVILDDQHRTDAALLRADDGAEIGVIDFAAFDCNHNDASFRFCILDVTNADRSLSRNVSG